MTKVIEDRLSRALTAMAERTTAEQDWQRVLADSERGRTAGSTPTNGDSRPVIRPLAVAAAVAILAGVGLLAVVGVEQNRSETDISAGVDYVLPGEEILSEEPLVVVSAIGPPPAFDTSVLGTELTFGSLGRG